MAYSNQFKCIDEMTVETVRVFGRRTGAKRGRKVRGNKVFNDKVATKTREEEGHQ